MALVLDETIGGASANTYATLAEAKVTAGTIFPASDAVAFLAASEDDQNRALVAAQRILDQEAWKGMRVTTTQALELPRAGLPKPGPVGLMFPSAPETAFWDAANYYLTTEIPPAAKTAQCQLAFWFLKQVAAGISNPAAPSDTAGLASISFGSELAMTFRGDSASVPALERFLAAVIRPALGGLVTIPQIRFARG